MRIILSRKGFDSSAGGVPSPIVDGRPHSMPIPTRMPTVTRFRDVENHPASAVAALTRGRIGPDAACHLDPDLDADNLPRQPGWRGALGQTGAAQSHLARSGVGVGDVFLFWGLFRPNSGAPDWRFKGSKEHRVFGWLQIGEVCPVDAAPERVLAQRPWLSQHPHLQAGNWSAVNTVYVAAAQLSLAGRPTGLRGWGLLHRGLRLTAPDSSLPSVWSVPSWLHPAEGGVGMTYHPPERWLPHSRLSAAARGQEFVADIGQRTDALEWLLSVLEEHD